jgi:multidrug efflux pump subunit AcrB
VRGDGQARFVLVVNDKGVVERRSVTVGQQHEGLRVVTTGLKESAWVVVGGPEGLRPGMAVRTRPEKQSGQKSADPPAEAATSAVPLRRGPAGPGIFVEAAYPGADLKAVADAVRAPIEEQLSTMAKLMYLRSRCTNDGRYALVVTFEPDTDLQRMQLLVHNRVNQAEPLLPAAVRRDGVWVRQGGSGVLAVVCLTSPDGRFDSTFLSNYATIQIKDELIRVAGVTDVGLIGQAEYGLRIWLDPERLAARNLNVGDVNRALAEQKRASPLDPDRLGDLLLKADGEGRRIFLRDVARVELGAGPRLSRASFDGKPVVALVIYQTQGANPHEVRTALRERLDSIRMRLPAGLALDASFDFTPNRTPAREYLMLDLDMPAAASAERTAAVLGRCEALVRAVPGVRHVLAMSENPFDVFGNRPCLLVLLTPAGQRKDGRAKISEEIRERVKKVEGATLRLRDLSEYGGYPIALAVSGPQADRVREWAAKFGERLRRTNKLTDVWVNPDSTPRRQRVVQIDREAALRLGVPLDDILTTLQVYNGGRPVAGITRFGRSRPVEVQADGDSDTWTITRFGRNWPVEVRADGDPGSRAKDLQRLQVRNARGEMIPLSRLITVREQTGPAVQDFLDHVPMVEITANPAPGESLKELRKLCERLAGEARTEAGLAGEYRLTWLRQLGTPNPKL